MINNKDPKRKCKMFDFSGMQLKPDSVYSFLRHESHSHFGKVSIPQFVRLQATFCIFYLLYSLLYDLWIQNYIKREKTQTILLISCCMSSETLVLLDTANLGKSHWTFTTVISVPQVLCISNWMPIMNKTKYWRKWLRDKSEQRQTERNSLKCKDKIVKILESGTNKK